MDTSCRDCRAGVEHCHGTLIRHLLRDPECTEDGCAGPLPTPHTFIIDCDAVGCGCGEPTAAAVGA
ncbi:hypothetical protein MSM1_06505 [Mycobacterium sp. SM1]|uniref:hypothetical protein n=1 Tax=Mycobacterium sp. SM1 TaxID=2816243 RepID=UPI001BD130E5|nr:hypothetical protein [Mycobacterium sp. SM1]MBS4728015.1 hypothetical protein [Mycobacterium sp. SM1]